MNAFNDRNDLNLPFEMQLFHQGVQNDDRLTALTHLHIDASTHLRIHSSRPTLYVFKEHEVIQLSQQRPPKFINFRCGVNR